MVKKVLLMTLAIIGLLFVSNAQEKKMMAGLNVGIIGAGCTNCGLAPGFGGSFSYAVSDNIVASIGIDRYTDKTANSWGSFKAIVNVVGVSAEYFPREALKGFFIGPDISYISLVYKWDGETFGEPQTNITAGLNLGWVATFGESISVVPHFGYGTWFEGSKGRVTMGLRLAYKI